MMDAENHCISTKVGSGKARLSDHANVSLKRSVSLGPLAGKHRIAAAICGIALAAAAQLITPLIGASAEEPPRANAPFSYEQAQRHQHEWAKHLDAPRVYENSIGMKMALIPPGEFKMGSTDEEIVRLLKVGADEGWLDEMRQERITAERPQHTVRVVEPFYFGAHEVTVGQFSRFITATGHQTTAEIDGNGGMGLTVVDGETRWRQSPNFSWRNPFTDQTDEHPVVNVSWHDAVAFCRWLSEKESETYRLPTEAQWEFACRSGSTTRWCFGSERSELERYAWYATTSPKAVGQKAANGFGLFDMHGNVRSWCLDWYSKDYYGRSIVDDPDGPPNGICRALRGGSFYVHPWLVRSASRSWQPPTFRKHTVGFRPTRTCP